MSDPREGLSRSVQIRLARHAREIGVDPNLVLTRYDAVTPAPQWLDYAGLLDLPGPQLRAYPRETVIAEKSHAIVRFGTRNSRRKDHFDIRALAREGSVDMATLADPITATFERRATEVPNGVPAGLLDSFVGEPGEQAQWMAFLARNRREAPSLAEVVPEVSA